LCEAALIDLLHSYTKNEACRGDTSLVHGEYATNEND